MRQVEAPKSTNPWPHSPLCSVLPEEVPKVGRSSLVSVSLLLAVSLFTPATSALASERPTLRTLRQKYLGQRVIVFGMKTAVGLMLWPKAVEVSPGQYKEDKDRSYFDRYLPVTYNGKKATVIAVQLHQSVPGLEPKEQRRNALGELVHDGDFVDPLVDLVVRFDDGLLAMAKGRKAISLEYRMGSTGLILASVRDRHARLMSEKLQSGNARASRPAGSQ